MLHKPSNRVEIGNTSVTWIGGQVNWSTYSDKRIKININEDVVGLDFILKLRPVTYYIDLHKENSLVYAGTNKDSTYWPEKYDIEKIKFSGFIAQEVEEAARDVGYNFSGIYKASDKVGLYSLSYSTFVVPLVKAIQEQQKIIERQQQEIDSLSNEILQLKLNLKNK